MLCYVMLCYASTVTLCQHNMDKFLTVFTLYTKIFCTKSRPSRESLRICTLYHTYAVYLTIRSNHWVRVRLAYCRLRVSLEWGYLQIGLGRVGEVRLDYISLVGSGYVRVRLTCQHSVHPMFASLSCSVLMRSQVEVCAE